MYFSPWMEQRRNLRLKEDLPLHYELWSGSKYGNCLTQDISEGGARIVLDNFIPRLSRIALKINLTPSKLIEINGEVKWAQRLSHSYRYQTGVEFKNIGIDTKRKIQKLIGEHSF